MVRFSARNCWLLPSTLVGFILLTCLSQSALGQQSETGIPPFGTFQGGGVDLVSLENGNPHIEIPILSVPPRAGPDVTYNFLYDLGSWEIDDSPMDTNGTTCQWSVGTVGQLAGFHLRTTPVGPASVSHDTVAKTCSYTTQSGTCSAPLQTRHMGPCLK